MLYLPNARPVMKVSSIHDSRAINQLALEFFMGALTGMALLLGSFRRPASKFFGQLGA